MNLIESVCVVVLIATVLWWTVATIIERIAFWIRRQRTLKRLKGYSFYVDAGAPRTRLVEKTAAGQVHQYQIGRTEISDESGYLGTGLTRVK